MADYTPRLGLIKPTPDEMVDIQAQINANSDKLDVQAGAFVCTSTTRPSAPYPGQIIYETDTGLKLMWDGSTWDPIGMQLWGSISNFGLPNIVSTVNPAINQSVSIDKIKITMPPGGPYSIVVTAGLNVGATVPKGTAWRFHLGLVSSLEEYNNDSLSPSESMSICGLHNFATSDYIMYTSTSGQRHLSTSTSDIIGLKVNVVRTVSTGALTFRDEFGYFTDLKVYVVSKRYKNS